MGLKFCRKDGKLKRIREGQEKKGMAKYNLVEPPRDNLEMYVIMV